MEVGGGCPCWGTAWASVAWWSALAFFRIASLSWPLSSSFSCLSVVVSSYTSLLLLKLSLPERTTFLPFRLLLLPLDPTEEERASGGVVLSCPPGLNRNNLRAN